jgi:hypothetical protein
MARRLAFAIVKTFRVGRQSTGHSALVGISNRAWATYHSIESFGVADDLDRTHTEWAPALFFSFVGLRPGGPISL